MIVELLTPNSEEASPNKNVYPISAELDELGRLMVGGCRLSELAEVYGTPLYVIDESTLRTACRAYKLALNKYYPATSLPLYASKANSSLAISNIIMFAKNCFFLLTSQYNKKRILIK